VAVEIKEVCGGDLASYKGTFHGGGVTIEFDGKGGVTFTGLSDRESTVAGQSSYTANAEGLTIKIKTDKPSEFTTQRIFARTYTTRVRVCDDPKSGLVTAFLLDDGQWFVRGEPGQWEGINLHE
jgi:hypothetical protein